MKRPFFWFQTWINPWTLTFLQISSCCLLRISPFLFIFCLYFVWQICKIWFIYKQSIVWVQSIHGGPSAGCGGTQQKSSLISGIRVLLLSSLTLSPQTTIKLQSWGRVRVGSRSRSNAQHMYTLICQSGLLTHRIDGWHNRLWLTLINQRTHNARQIQ